MFNDAFTMAVSADVLCTKVQRYRVGVHQQPDRSLGDHMKAQRLAAEVGVEYPDFSEVCTQLED